jgi:hypothetical protein
MSFDQTKSKKYMCCPESIQTYWISREPVAWPYCNLSASERRPYCASVNTHSPVGLISRQWDAAEWACVLCYCRIHNDRASRSASSRQCACPFYSSSCRLLWQNITSPRSLSPLQPRFGSLRLMAFPKAIIAFERADICECDAHTVHKLSQRGLTAEWLVPRKRDCSEDAQ